MKRAYFSFICLLAVFLILSGAMVVKVNALITTRNCSVISTDDFGNPDYVTLSGGDIFSGSVSSNEITVEGTWEHGTACDAAGCHEIFTGIPLNMICFLNGGALAVITGVGYWNLEGALHGLNNAYCGGMDCDSATPRASARACEMLYDRYVGIAGHGPICEAGSDPSEPSYTFELSLHEGLPESYNLSVRDMDGMDVFLINDVTASGHIDIIFP